MVRPRFIAAFAFILTAIAAMGIVSCESKKSGSGKKTTVPTPTPPGTGYDGSQTAGIEITASGAVGNNLAVTLNLPATWTFSAVGRDGTGATISSIQAQNQPAGMVISGQSVSFTPRSNTDLAGNLTVFAKKASGDQDQKTFYWAPTTSLNGSGSFGNGLGSALISLLPSILEGKLNAGKLIDLLPSLIDILTGKQSFVGGSVNNTSAFNP